MEEIIAQRANQGSDMYHHKNNTKNRQLLLLYCFVPTCFGYCIRHNNWTQLFQLLFLKRSYQYQFISFVFVQLYFVILPLISFIFQSYLFTPQLCLSFSGFLYFCLKQSWFEFWYCMQLLCLRLWTALINFSYCTITESKQILCLVFVFVL